MTPSPSTLPVTARWLRFALPLLLLLFFTVQGPALGTFERDYDEGVYLAEAHLLLGGHELYSEVASASPPFFLWGLQGIFLLAGGPSVIAARMGIILTGALGLLTMAWAGYRLAGQQGREVVALAAAALLLLLPRWLFYGQLAMADIPSLSFSLLAVALALEGWRGGRRWYALAGGVAAIAMGIKMLAAYTPPLLAWIVLLGYRSERPWSARRFLLDGLATLAGFVAPLLLALPFLPLQATYQTIFRFPWEAGRQWSAPLEALRLIAIFHWEHPGWALLALAGLAALAHARRWRVLALLVGWEALVVLMLSQHAPLWGHLLLPLAPPLALAGALALPSLLASRPAARPLRAASLLALLAFALLWPRALRADQATIVAPAEQALLREQIVPWLQRTVPVGERVLSDDPMIAVRSGRLVPYDMSDTSFTKIASGFLDAPRLIAATERDRPAAIIFWSDRFRSLPEWEAWVQDHYRIGYELSPTRRIYVRPDLLP